VKIHTHMHALSLYTEVQTCFIYHLVIIPIVKISTEIFSEFFRHYIYNTYELFF
jgi:hypothetical protein